MIKKTSSFRLSEACRNLLKDLAKEKGVSQSAVIELAIRAEARKHGKK